ncbi:unnamed protein product [marine sediment metagenome]|uniref:Uncharacterized protein n=1 Tax=marine sediment metagenome TaxID=412755 RepID=X0YXT3_9ZZZZ
MELNKLQEILDKEFLNMCLDARIDISKPNYILKPGLVLLR